MTRRPKLSLSPADAVDKKQAPGFEAAAAPSEDSETTSSATESTPENPAAHNTVIGDDKAVPQATDWFSGRKLVKVVLVVAAAALSLYLLKRRLS